MTAPLSMTERQWLQNARFFIRMALVKAEIGDWDTVVSQADRIVRSPLLNEATMEVANLLASLAATKPSDLRSNAAMRAAATRRLEETKSFIGATLVATTDR